MDEPKKKQGFAAIDPKRQREIASMGGKSSSGNFKNCPERAVEAGRKGGSMSQKARKANP